MAQAVHLYWVDFLFDLYESEFGQFQLRLDRWHLTMRLHVLVHSVFVYFAVRSCDLRINQAEQERVRSTQEIQRQLRHRGDNL